jgi:hypothetical protein
MNNRGEITVAKLVTIILAAVVLVLVIVGVATGALKPLEEKIGSFFDRVGLWFGGNLPDSQRCQIYSADCPGGCIRIAKGDLTGSFSLCKDACYFVADKEYEKIAEKGSYQVINGIYYDLDEGIEYPNQEEIEEISREIFKVKQRVYSYDYNTDTLSNLVDNSPETITTEPSDVGLESLIQIYENLIASKEGEPSPHEEFTVRFASTNLYNMPAGKTNINQITIIEDGVYTYSLLDSDFLSYYTQKGRLPNSWYSTSPFLGESTIGGAKEKIKDFPQLLTLFQEECK